jgi:hypothetical protein
MNLDTPAPSQWLRIDLAESRTGFRPGETVEGTASWSLAEPPDSAELRLFWWTEGRGDQDVGVVETAPFSFPAAQERRSFRLTLPEGPWSFHGKLISLQWGLELVIEPGSWSSRQEITLTPAGEEILLHPRAVLEEPR